MKANVLILLLCLVHVLALGNTRVETEGSIAHVSKIGTNNVWLVIHDGDVKSVPDWDPDEGQEPPLLPQAAVVLAKKAFNECVNNPREYVIQGIGIEQYRLTRKWYYRIWFVKSQAKSSRVVTHNGESVQYAGSAQILVLMSGQVISGRPEKHP